MRLLTSPSPCEFFFFVLSFLRLYMCVPDTVGIFFFLLFLSRIHPQPIVRVDVCLNRIFPPFLLHVDITYTSLDGTLSFGTPKLVLFLWLPFPLSHDSTCPQQSDYSFAPRPFNASVILVTFSFLKK
eukprot:RCo003419